MRLIRNGRMRNYVNEIFTIFIISATLVYICRSHGRERHIVKKSNFDKNCLLNAFNYDDVRIIRINDVTTVFHKL